MLKTTHAWICKTVKYGQTQELNVRRKKNSNSNIDITNKTEYIYIAHRKYYFMSITCFYVRCMYSAHGANSQYSLSLFPSSAVYRLSSVDSFPFDCCSRFFSVLLLRHSISHDAGSCFAVAIMCCLTELLIFRCFCSSVCSLCFVIVYLLFVSSF